MYTYTHTYTFRHNKSKINSKPRTPYEKQRRFKRVTARLPFVNRAWYSVSKSQPYNFVSSKISPVLVCFV